MTCIVGIEKQGKVYMGGDSYVSSNWGYTPTYYPKIFMKDGFIIGGAGEIRSIQLLKANLEIPFRSADISPDDYICGPFVAAIRKCLEDGGYTSKENDHEHTESAFLVGENGRLWSIYGDFGVCRSLRGFSAIGAGEDFALGALAVLDKNGYEPRETLMRVLKAVGELCAYVQAPFSVYPEVEEDGSLPF